MKLRFHNTLFWASQIKKIQSRSPREGNEDAHKISDFHASGSAGMTSKYARLQITLIYIDAKI